MVENLKARFLFIGVILVACVASIVGPMLKGEPAFNLGLDLRGGTEMHFSFPDIADMRQDEREDALNTVIQIFNNRLNATGVEEISVRGLGDSEIEVQIPGISPDEAENYKAILTSQGKLVFVVPFTGAPGVDLTKLQEAFDAELQRRRDAGIEINKESIFSETLAGVTLPGGDTLKWVPISESYEPDYRRQNSIPAEEDGGPPGPFFMLLRYEGDKNPTGAWLESVSKDVDQQTGLRAVAFSVKRSEARSAQFGDFTKDHQGEQMAIVLDGVIQSAPTINSEISTRGIITGGSEGFDADEQENLVAVLKGGSVDSRPELKSESGIGPSLGKVAIDRGLTAGLLALGLVLVFMLFYYVKAGMVACMALGVNMLLLMGCLAFLDATLTMPGIAGLVLTIGMAVDANILIFERIREEREKGKTIAQAVRNGFDRAFYTIVDANVTTFLTAFFLYRFGTPTIRGFAVTLMIGIATSMFSALYFSRAVFAVWVDKKLQNLPMKHVLSAPKFEFIKHRKVAAIGSITAILIGLGAFIFSPNRDDMIGMDFSGGYVAQLQFNSMDVDEAAVRDRVRSVYDKVDVIRVSSEEGDVGSRFQVKIKLEGEDLAASRDEGDSKKQDIGRKIRTEILDAFRDSTQLPLVKEGIENLSLSQDEQGQASVQFRLNFASEVDAETVRNTFSGALGDAVSVRETGDRSFEVAGVLARAKDEAAARVTIDEQVRKIKDAGGEAVALSNPTPVSSFIGGRAGDELRDSAIRAILFSLIGIIIYIRIRFKQYRYGLAASLALLHDVAITFGVMSLVKLLVPSLDLEINLAVIAAFLTIIGYSLNDTIVIFDRVRENMPRLDQPLNEVLDRSINQTLSRTILTTMTTFLVVLILFIFNVGQRNVLEGFSFSLLIGVLVGTYSTMFIASPAVLFLARRAERKKAEARAA